MLKLWKGTRFLNPWNNLDLFLSFLGMSNQQELSGYVNTEIMK